MEMTRLRAVLVATGLTLAASAPLPAQAPSVFDLEPGLQEADAEAPPVYQVEILIFAYNEFNPAEEEFEPEPPRWPKSFTGASIRATPHTLQPSSADWMLESLWLPTDPATETGTDLGGSGAAAGAEIPIAIDPASAAGTPDAPSGPAVTVPATDEFDDFGNTFGPAPSAEDDGPWYTLLEADELQLDRAFARLNNLDAYTPLVHTGWSQEALLEDEAEAFDLGTLGRLRPAGTIRLHRSRFLHLTLDLVLQDDYRYRFAPLAFDDPAWPLAELAGPLRYRIDVQRRVRSDEVHFFDHPAFGVLIAIRPQPEDPEVDGELQIGPAA